jgi:hypothetical protein
MIRSGWGATADEVVFLREKLAYASKEKATVLIA